MDYRNKLISYVDRMQRDKLHKLTRWLTLTSKRRTFIQVTSAIALMWLYFIYWANFMSVSRALALW